MVNMNRILIIAVSVLVLVALAGTASAAVTFKVDKIQTNGVYHGIPTLLSGDTARYGYEYTLVPDGTFTVFGTVTNDAYEIVRVGVDIGYAPDVYYKDFEVPAAVGKKPGVASFEITMPAASAKDIQVWVTVWTDGSQPFVPFSLSGVDYVDAPQSSHTIDQGPMSDATAIFSNGNMTYNGLPAFMVSYQV